MLDTDLGRQSLSVVLTVLMVASMAATGTAGGVTTTDASPALEAGNTVAAAAPADALYRVNAGGSTVADSDAGPDWTPPGSTSGVSVSGGSTYSTEDSVSTDASVPDSTPPALFTTELYGDTQWEFDVSAGQEYEVRLYFAEIFHESSGQRAFDVSIEGQQVLDAYDPYTDVGHDVGTMKSFTATSDDGTLAVDFTTVTDNAKVSAIEILPAEAEPNTLGAPSGVDFGTVVTGEGAAETVTLSNLGSADNASHPAIEVTDVSVSGADSGAFSTDFSGSTTLAPGASTDVQVTFAPSDAGAKSATLEVTHNGSNSPLTVDLSGDGSSDVPVGFGSSELQGFSQGSLTALEFGPDGRLYVAQQDGDIYALNVTRTGENAYSVTSQEQVTVVKNIPNHDDNGEYVPGESTRQVTGLTVGGTASQPVVYVSSSDPTIDVGTDDDDTDTNSGAVSRLTFDWNPDGSLAGVDHEVLVLGLPRSEENHATNGLALSDDGSTLYVAQGGHTNKGAPSDNFGHTPEYALSAAVLSVDLDQIDQNYQPKNLSTYTPQGGGSYPSVEFLYAIPTIQNNDTTPGDDLPFGGNDGINQAMWVADGPVQVYSSGYRNPYDLTLSEDGQLYVIDNGPNGGWGGQPADASGNTDEAACTNHPNEDGSYGTGDQLHVATEGSYGGHPAPIRGNPTGADIYDADGNLVFDINASNSPVPASEVDPVECDYQDPTEDNSIGSTFGWTGGIVEYTASNFGGAMQGDLLVVESGSSVERVELNASGTGVTAQEDNFFTPGTALGIAAVGDDGPFPGTVWTARGDLTVFEPTDYGGSGGQQCSGADDPSLDEDGDGYDNADEIDAGTDPCSAASTPADFDDDGTSNVNDPDDDNDGLPDTTDPFATDPDNGLTTTLPVQDDFSETKLFGENSQVWTGLMTNGSGYQSLYDPGQLTVGGAAQVLTVENVPAGDAVNDQNNQQFAFQFGVDPPTEPFTVSTTVTGFPETPSNYQGMGVYIGNGDQDNYAKLIVSANGGTGGVQFAKEAGGSFQNIAQPDDSNVTGPGTNTDLALTVDPTTDPNPGNGVDEVAVTAAYATDGGNATEVASGAVPASWLNTSDGSGLAVGVISTSYQAGSTFDATWTDISVDYVSPPANQPPVADVGADMTVDEGQQVTLDASGSTDPDGDTLGYTWTQTAGTPTGLLDQFDGEQVSFTAPDVDGTETFTFEVSVSDGDASDTDTVNVTVEDTDAPTGDVVYRVNAGGGELAATDGGPAWSADTGSSPSQYVNADGDNGLNTYSTTDTVALNDSVPSGTPPALFQTERYDENTSGSTADDTEMQWSFPAQSGTTYEVRLYFAEIFLDSSNVDSQGPRTFDVVVEGETELNDYNLYQQYGHDVGAMESFTVTPDDGTLNVTFLHEQENPKVSAVEVVQVGETNTPPTVDAIADQTVAEGTSTTVDVSASDPDGDQLSLSLSGAPAFASLSDAGDGTGTLTLAPGAGDAGSYQFDVVADDGNATASEPVNVTVEAPQTGSYGVETGAATDVQIDTSTLTNASATLNGTLTLGEKSEATPYVKVWVQGQPEDAFWYTGEPTATSGEFQFDVVLSPSTTYVWQPLVQSGDGTWTAGDAATFTTPTGQFFGVGTTGATNVGVESATLNGEVLNLGDNDNATVYFTYWEQGSKASTLTWYTGPVQESAGAFSAEVGLDPDTAYEYRAFAQSDEGEWKAGPVETFTTQDGQPYAVETGPATDVGAESATLQGNLTGLGDYDSATVYFQYWVEGQKGSTLSWWTGSTFSSTGAFDADVTGLAPDTTYAFQAYAQSDGGKWTAGNVGTLTTTAAGTNQPPTASFSVNESSPTAGQPVSFDASASGDTDGSVASYEWTLGDGTTAAGVTATHAYDSAGTYTVALTVTDDDGATDTATQTLTVTEPAAPASATLEITPGAGLEASTYGGGSFQVTNTGEQNVTSVTLDLSSTTLPDMVFDPDGTAGDGAAKGLTIDSQSGDGVGVVSTADGDVFSQPHNGVNGSDGYDVLTVEFTDFEPGESVSFSADNDPTSIKGATLSSQEAGPVSGLELARATVTVGYESTTQTTQTVGDGSPGGAEAVADGSVPAAPGLGVAGVSLDSTVLDGRHSAATVTDADQTVTVSGPAGANVTLVQVEGELELSNVPDYNGTPGYEVEAYEANKAENVTYYSATVGSDGTVEVPVTLTNSTAVGGYNYFVAHVEDDAGAGVGSNVVVLEYDPGSAQPQALHRVNAGESTTLPATDGGPDWTGVADTSSGYLASVAPSASGTYCGGTITSTASVPNGTPDGVFDCERYGNSTWTFDVTSGESVEVRLYLGNQFSGTSEPGDRQFNVSIEGEQVLTQYDPVADVGHQVGTMKSFTVTEDGDGTVTVAFDQGAVENPQVNAIEVLTVPEE